MVNYKVFITLLFVVSQTCFKLRAQDETSGIYSGGMLILQPGYTITQNYHQKIEDRGFGLGGILRFYFYDYFTAGINGGTQRTNYTSSDSENSYISLGYGGPFVGFSIKHKRLRYTASFFVGRGSVKNLHIQSQNGNTLTDAYLYYEKTLVTSPIISLDFELTKRLVITSQIVYLTARFQDDKLYNPTFQLGLLFNR
jgi:hypothetical protein